MIQITTEDPVGMFTRNELELRRSFEGSLAPWRTRRLQLLFRRRKARGGLDTLLTKKDKDTADRRARRENERLNPAMR